MKIRVLNEMALSREIAVDRCIGLGRRFIEHFKKIYDAFHTNHPLLSIKIILSLLIK